MNILEVKDLCKTYIVNKRQNNVLKNVNFMIDEGEMVAVMGPSGSGKSTLLYAVSGMDDLTAGEVNFCGKNIAGMSERELADLRLDEMGLLLFDKAGGRIPLTSIRPPASWNNLSFAPGQIGHGSGDKRALFYHRFF